LDEPHREADIILTNHPEVTLFMRFADCVPIMLYDPTKKAIGLIHAGWRGAVHQACRVAVEAMCKAYQTNPGDIAAVIGPSVGPDHYEVGLDVVHEVEAWLPDIKSEILFKIDGKYILDLWKTNTLVLQKARVKTIDVAEICTACHTDDWFSHRGDHGKTGRYGALIAL
jgi:polyphenol oxidase